MVSSQYLVYVEILCVEPRLRCVIYDFCGPWRSFTTFLSSASPTDLVEVAAAGAAVYLLVPALLGGVASVGTGEKCSPRHRMRFYSRNEGSNCG